MYIVLLLGSNLKFEVFSQHQGQLCLPSFLGR